MTKVLHIVGARPQFVKAAPVSRALASEGLEEILVHTGQHYDWEMSAAFFKGLNLPEPVVDLGVGSASHGTQTGRMLEALEAVMSDRRPDWVLVHGDTNSTIAGALAAAKLHIPVAHVEAGLRSFNRQMPEEINRVVTDHLSALLFAPTDRAIDNLSVEGISKGVIRTGDVMYDLVLEMEATISSTSDRVLEREGLQAGQYAFVTIHRPENTDDPVRFATILEALTETASQSVPVIWPIHPRARDLVRDFSAPGVVMLNPLPYLEAQILVRHARVVVTDSGGLQKEAAFHHTPCVTVRDQTEWVELVEAGLNRVVPPVDQSSLVEAVFDARWPASGLPDQLYGDGAASLTVARSLSTFL